MEQTRLFASCHNHSTFSDGEYKPETLARIAQNMGHGGIILSDPGYDCPYEHSGVTEKDFMTIYERRLG